MVPKNDVVVGLDIGTTKVCCVIGEVSREGNVEIVGNGSTPSSGMSKGVVLDIDKTVKSIEGAVAEAERMAGFNIGPVYAGVSGEHISSLNSHGVISVASSDKEIVEEDVKRVIEAAKVLSIPSDREVIHVIPRSFSIDGQNGVKNPVGMSGIRLEVDTHIVTGVSTFLQNVNKCVQKAGLELEGNAIVLEPVASSLAVLNEAEKELGTVLVDIGGGTTDIAVFLNGGIYHTAVLPVGGNHVSRDIAVAFRTPPEEAERVKIEYGWVSVEQVEEDQDFQISTLSQGEPESISLKRLAEIIEPRVEEILSLVKQEIFRVCGEEVFLAGVTLTGGTSLLKGMASFAEKVLGLPVRLGVPGNVPGMVESLKSPVYSTSVGLVLYGARNRQDRKYRMRHPQYFKVIWSRISHWFKEVF
ncbi:MAG: cell division protein FtsA [Armatimonadetes bacterium]|nr:cell division protein FtsA [Armatimonadota bacterium]